MSDILIDRLNVPAYIAEEDGKSGRMNSVMKHRVVRLSDDGDFVLCFLSHQKEPQLFVKADDVRIAFHYLQYYGQVVPPDMLKLLGRLTAVPSAAMALISERESLHPLLRGAMFYTVPFEKNSFLPPRFLDSVLRKMIKTVLTPHHLTCVMRTDEGFPEAPCRHSDLDMICYLFYVLLLHFAERKADGISFDLGVDEEKYSIRFSYSVKEKEREETIAFLRSLGAMIDPFCRGFDWHTEDGKFYCEALDLSAGILAPVLAEPDHEILPYILYTNLCAVSDILSSISFGK